MEAQLTDFENAAFTVMTVLISRVLLAFRLNLYIPLSKVDANMATAHKRDSVIKDTFWFRKHMATPESLAEVRFDRVAVERYIFDLWSVRMGWHRGEIWPCGGTESFDHKLIDEHPQDSKSSAPNQTLHQGETEDDVEEMSIYEILTGKGTHYAGLLPMVFAYLDQIGCDTHTRDKIRQYAKLLERRAKVSWMVFSV
jgi:glutamate--cysteine ligase catalytic subunit